MARRADEHHGDAVCPGGSDGLVGVFDNGWVAGISEYAVLEIHDEQHGTGI